MLSLVYKIRREITLRKINKIVVVLFPLFSPKVIFSQPVSNDLTTALSTNSAKQNFRHVQIQTGCRRQVKCCKITEFVSDQSMGT